MTDSFSRQYNPAWYEHNGPKLKLNTLIEPRTGAVLTSYSAPNSYPETQIFINTFFRSIRRSVDSLLRFQYLITLPQKVAENRPICGNPCTFTICAAQLLSFAENAGLSMVFVPVQALSGIV